ncbi:MAG: hypothetical protein CL525_13790 [Aequorivita sp.]|nr:hypothetical protein [Aequorivita sp.]
MLFEYFLNMNKEVLKNIYKKDKEKGLIAYGAVVLRRSFTSKTSSYYYKYRRYYDVIHGGERHKDYTTEKHAMYTEGVEVAKWEMLEKIDKELDTIYWYDREIYKIYYSPEKQTLDSIAKKTGISRNSLFTTLDNVRIHLKSKIKTDE